MQTDITAAGQNFSGRDITRVKEDHAAIVWTTAGRDRCAAIGSDEVTVADRAEVSTAGIDCTADRNGSAVLQRRSLVNDAPDELTCDGPVPRVSILPRNQTDPPASISTVPPPVKTSYS